MALAIFDLDHTLLGGDSDYLWGEFLVERELVDASVYDEANKRFYRDYMDGALDIDAFLRFSLKPLTEYPTEQLHVWREEFLNEKIHPVVLPKAKALLQQHRDRGDTLLIISATNRFVTAPIAALLEVPHLLSTTPEMHDGRYTGRYVGTPTFREGKIAALHEWLEEHEQSLDDSSFYSDSRNDIPLLEEVDYPVAVDPDQTLRAHAEANGWPIISLR